jgi:hypothetical protein
MSKEYQYAEQSWYTYYTKTKEAYTEKGLTMTTADVKDCMYAYIHSVKLEDYLLSLGGKTVSK